jgi:hypothetical protein
MKGEHTDGLGIRVIKLYSSEGFGPTWPIRPTKSYFGRFACHAVSKNCAFVSFSFFLLIMFIHYSLITSFFFTELLCLLNKILNILK